MNKNRFNTLLNKSIKRKKIISQKKFFYRLITNPGMFIQTIFCLFLSRFEINFNLITNTFWGGKMQIVLPELVSSEIRRYGYIEETVASFIINFCYSEDTVIDIGSHFGFFALLMSEIVGDKGYVHCFEPTPSTFSILKKNLIQKKNIILNRNAIYSKNTEIELNDYGFSSSAFNSISETREKENYRKSYKKKFKTKAITLDDYVRNKNIKPTLIKIDAESSEYEVIKGMDYILREIRPKLCIELGDLGIKGAIPSREIIDILIQEYGYKIYEMSGGKLYPHKLKRNYNYINLFLKN